MKKLLILILLIMSLGPALWSQDSADYETPGYLQPPWGSGYKDVLDYENPDRDIPVLSGPGYMIFLYGQYSAGDDSESTYTLYSVYQFIDNQFAAVQYIFDFPTYEGYVWMRNNRQVLYDKMYQATFNDDVVPYGYANTYNDENIVMWFSEGRGERLFLSLRFNNPFMEEAKSLAPEYLDGHGEFACDRLLDFHDRELKGITRLTDEEITDNIFDVSTGEFINREPAVMVFSTDWCSYCNEYIPQVEKSAAKHGDRIDYYLVDGDDTAFVQAFGIAGFPATLFLGFDSQYAYSGVLPLETLEKILQEQFFLNA